MPSDEHELLPLGTGFDVVRRGYDRAQVEEHLDRVEADLRILTADRDAAVHQATELARALDHHRAHVEDLRAQVDRLSAPPDTMEGLSERLQRMLRLAQDETRAMREEASEAARRVREEADEYARRARTEADEQARTTIGDADDHARQMVERAEAQARATLDEARRQAREIHESAEAEAEEARHRYDDGLADNEQRRHAMESEHLGVMEAARAEAARLREEAEDHARHTTAAADEHARTVVAEADERARRTIEESERERARLDAEGRTSREQIENDFAVAMSSRRREAMHQLEADEQASRERAEKYVHDAAEEARRRLREADAEVAEMRRLRDRVGQQLVTLRAALGGLPTVDAFPDEADRDGRPTLPDPPASGPRPAGPGGTNGSTVPANSTTGGTAHPDDATEDLGGATAPEQRSAASSR